MALIEEHLKDKEYHRLYNQERVILEVTEALCEYMEDHDISRIGLARRLNKNKSFISQVLNGGRNLTLRTLADFLWALECEPRFNLVPAGTPRRDEEAEWREWSGRKITRKSKKTKNVKPA
ncbi:MAG: helix-turn-helix transcriptional regulator, partial [Deltaproteobacteria bacterium]|nr:helix-turn-helix transcriptional regulator [Deltaproteobacteria bacterium]